METTKQVRTYLSKVEVERLKFLAKQSGMTITGYRDWLCREAIKKELVAIEPVNEQRNYGK